MASRAYFSNNLVYCGCLLFLTGLYRPGHEPWLLRFQVAILYFGAGLNKAMDGDWRSGQFFEYWFGHVHHHLTYLQLASLAPPLLLSRFMSGIAIATEFALAGAFLVRRWFPFAIWLGLLYHTAILVLMDSTFSMFYYAALISYLAFVTWPERPVTVVYDGGLCEKTRALFGALDIDRQFNWRPLQIVKDGQGVGEDALRASLHLFCGAKVYNGYRAFKMLLLYNPATYFALALALRAPENWHIRRWIAAGVLLMFSALVAPVGEAVYRLIARNRAVISKTCALESPHSSATAS